MKSIDSLMKKALELKQNGLSEKEIGDELHLSIETITWLLTRNVKGGAPPADVKIGWRSMGIYGRRIAMVSELLGDMILEEMEKRDETFDVVVGVAINGIPLATCISAHLDTELAIYRHIGEGDDGGTFLSNYATLAGKKVIIVDDVLSSGATIKGAINALQDQNAQPILSVVLVNKTPQNDIVGVPLRALVRARSLV